MYAFESFVMSTPDACVVDLVPPTFAGIVSAVPQANGSILASWLAATDAGSGVDGYEVYIHKSSNPAVDLWLSSNLAKITDELSTLIYNLRGNVALETGVEYRIGVRARDNVGNVDSNLVSLLAVSTGVLTSSLATIAAQVQAASIAITAAADAVGGGIEIEAETDPDIEIEVENDPEIDLETDC